MHKPIQNPAMHRYILQPYSSPSSRYHCPACNHRTKTFSRYIDTQTNQHIAPHVGRCSREDNCGYHFTPRQFFGELIVDSSWMIAKKPKARFSAMNYQPSSMITLAMNHELSPMSPPLNRIHADIVNDSFVNYHQNNFVQYLIKRFGFNKADELVGRYRIGTSNHWQGATVFWQLDILGQVRTGKIMLYHTETGKRVKQPFNHITWAHTLISKQLACCDGQPSVGVVLPNNGKAPIPASELPKFHLEQCLFGEHLLADAPLHQPVAIAESEKNAIIGNAILPQFVWLAAGSLHNLQAHKCIVLQGRSVFLFPDVNAYEKWEKQATLLRQLMPGTRFTVYRYLEQMASVTDRERGVDFGDVVG
ncbi:DUF6371 domain-containing protein [Mucilaginibacter pedocola]|uniref:Uncharacterized protein n=1 Tax=Mucilaginibacter pedocola TaxID=1792845 RepID=A0A1S9PI72_9SPHI|nr:DUF6371 domain-containing protein [Mucilaginibacter pedocola]OOQ60644.1 hypothetical protein BC343_23900 [Mucilaginibacter pedocola]